MSFSKCHAEEIYVRVATGEHFFGIDYIRSGHTDKDLFHELAYGTVVHEDQWLKKHQPKEESDETRKSNVRPERTRIWTHYEGVQRQGCDGARSPSSKQVKHKGKMYSMCSLIAAAIVFSLLWLLYH